MKKSGSQDQHALNSDYGFKRPSQVAKKLEQKLITHGTDVFSTQKALSIDGASINDTVEASGKEQKLLLPS